jgi:hypothetical protein
MTQDNLAILLAKGQINAIEFYNLFKNRHPPPPSSPSTIIKSNKNKPNRSSSKSRFQAYQQPIQQRPNYIVSNILHNERIKKIRQKFYDNERLREYRLNDNDDEIFQISSDDNEMSCSISSSSSSSSNSCSSVKTSRRRVKPGCEKYQVSPYSSQITFNLKISIMQTEVADIINVLKEVNMINHSICFVD